MDETQDELPDDIWSLDTFIMIESLRLMAQRIELLVKSRPELREGGEPRDVTFSNMTIAELVSIRDIEVMA